MGVHASEYGLHRRSAAEPGVLAQAQRPRARRVDYEKLDRKYALRGGESASEPRCRFGPRMGGIGGVRGQVGEYAWGGNQVQAAYSPPYRILHSFPLPETCPPPAHHLRGRAVEYARGGNQGQAAYLGGWAGEYALGRSGRGLGLGLAVAWAGGRVGEFGAGLAGGYDAPAAWGKGDAGQRWVSLASLRGWSGSSGVRRVEMRRHRALSRVGSPGQARLAPSGWASVDRA